MKRLKTGMAEIILLVIGLAIIIGSLTFFSACGAKEDGSFMNCHWAQVIITSLGALISAEALAAVIVPNRMFRAGLEHSVGNLDFALHDARYALPHCHTAGCAAFCLRYVCCGGYRSYPEYKKKREITCAQLILCLLKTLSESRQEALR